ncbi:MAG TPA: hypothetical protein VNL13_00625 [Sulfolobales archaeon]|nr:hypothetical protein [Sulfolobales archaeon]
MRILKILVEIIPRVSILSILLPISLKTAEQAPFILSIPQLVLGGRLDIASIPILLLVSLISCIATFIVPSPSLYTLTLFFTSLVILPGSFSGGNLLTTVGLYQAIFVLFVILVMDVVRNHYRGGAATPVISYEASLKDLVKGFSLFLALIIAVPCVVSIYIASYIFSFKLYSASPYLSTVISFLNSNPVGSILVASVLLGVFYMLTRQAIEAIISYVIPSPRVALTDLSRSIDLRWIKPPLSSLRGFILSSVITPPVYYIVREALRIAGLVVQSGQEDLYSRIALGVIGLAMFLAIWSILSRSMFSEEREPTPRRIAVLVLIMISIYVISYLAGVSLGFPASPSLDNMLSPLTAYYRDAWIVAELVVRAMGVAP